MQIPINVIGSWVSFYKNLRPSGASTGRDVLFLGIRHAKSDRYTTSDKSPTFIPNLLEQLVGQSATLSRTALLLEVPPFLPTATLDSPDVEEVVGIGDPILTATLQRVRTLFATGGEASKNGWSLVGADLRTRLRWSEGRFARNKLGNIRDTIMVEPLPFCLDLTWTQSFIPLYDYYWYLIAQTSSSARFDAMVDAFSTRTESELSTKQIKKEIFAQSAGLCRSLYRGIPSSLSTKIILHLIDQVAKLEDMPNPETNDVVECIAHRLMDLGIMGHIFSSSTSDKNVVVLAGHNHIGVIERFIETHRTHVTWDAHVKGTTSIESDDAVVTLLKSSIEIT